MIGFMQRAAVYLVLDTALWTVTIICRNRRSNLLAFVITVLTLITFAVFMSLAYSIAVAIYGLPK